MKWVVFCLAAVLFVLHQDFWNFDKAGILFGFLPIGLAYHAAYAFACSAMGARRATALPIRRCHHSGSIVAEGSRSMMRSEISEAGLQSAQPSGAPLGPWTATAPASRSGRVVTSLL